MTDDTKSPTPAIPEAAVEAALVEYARHAGHPKSKFSYTTHNRMRAALAAALPYLATPARADNVAAGLPQKFCIPGVAIANLVFQCGSNENNTEFFDAIGWVGELTDDHGNKVNGLHAYSTEYPEDGSVTLAEFPLVPYLATPAPNDNGAGVRQLEWNPFEAKPAVGEYRVSDAPMANGQFGAWYNTRMVGAYASVSAAKAAAQADYEARIRSALVPATSVAEPSETEIEAYRARRPYLDDEPNGYMESDRDYVANNLDLAVSLLDALASRIPPVHPAPVGEPSMAAEWRCFHCDEVFTDEHCARLHFGSDETRAPACQIKGSEHGLLEALREAENDAADAQHALLSETTDASKAYYSQNSRHQRQMRAVEQTGYDRGIADAKAYPETIGLAPVGERDKALEEAAKLVDADAFGQVSYEETPLAIAGLAVREYAAKSAERIRALKTQREG